jgi:hypothetical protein
MDIERFISAQTPFHQLTAEERRDLAGRFVAEDVARGSTDFRIGGEDGAFYLISEGAGR